MASRILVDVLHMDLLRGTGPSPFHDHQPEKNKWDVGHYGFYS